MIICVTGCAGFIGSHTSNRLLGLGHKVIGIDNLDPYYSLNIKHQNLKGLAHKNFKFVKEDIRSSKIETILKRHQPQIIIHLAAKAGVRNSLLHPQEYTDVNVLGTLNLLEAAKKTNAIKVLIASSSSVYGSNEKVPFGENDPVEHQVSPYAASKRAMEVICKTYAQIYGLNLQLFRFFTVYGPAGRPDMAPFLFTRAITEKKPINVFGDMRSQRDYTYIDDIVNGLMGAIKRQDIFEIYNLGNNQPITLGTFISTLEKILQKKAILRPRPRQPGDVERTWADISKAKKNLNYQPKVTLKKGLSQFATWYFENKQLYGD